MKKKWISLGLTCSLLLAAGGCANQNGSQQDTPNSQEESEYVPTYSASFEAEEGAFAGNVKTGSFKNGFTGTGYVEGFVNDDDSCTITIEVPEDGHYDLNFISASSGGEKHNYVSVDGEQVGTVFVEDSDFTDSITERVYMTGGTHQVTVTKYWGWILLDRVDVTSSKPISEAIYQVNNKLVNPKASKNAKKLYSYLCEIYGDKILSGQYCDTGMYGKEFQVIKEETGKTPAILGLDLMNYSPTNVKNGTKGNSLVYAQNFWENGGIVTFCWHWTVPEKYLTGTWYSSFYKEHTNIDLAKIMNGGDEEGYDLLMSDIDAIAEELKVLQEADVPILFRPLHEASGGWFWWGTGGAEAYKKLYITMYEKLTEEHGLNNLIWVWNGQAADWYPGDEYVDIIGEDLYPGEKVYTSQVSSYLNAATNYAQENKLVYMTENGCIFDPELAKRDGAMWGMWCTWSGEFVAKDVAIYSLSEQYTEREMLQKAYADEDVLTLEDLPDWQSR